MLALDMRRRPFQTEWGKLDPERSPEKQEETQELCEEIPQARPVLLSG